LSRSALEDMRTRPDRVHDGRVALGYLFNCLQRKESFLGTRGNSGAALSQYVGAGAQVTRGGPRAAPSRGTGAGATETRDGPETALS
jgi:hypothetical protein